MERNVNTLKEKLAEIKPSEDQQIPVMDLSVESTRLFIDLAEDAGNWSGTPLWGGNVGGGRQDRGNLTDLKKKGLVTTDVDEGQTWIFFTALGTEVARRLGIDVS